MTQTPLLKKNIKTVFPLKIYIASLYTVCIEITQIYCILAKKKLKYSNIYCILAKKMLKYSNIYCILPKKKVKIQFA